MNKFRLSKMQEQFWILNKLNNENPAYNLPSVFRIKGLLNIDALKSAIVIIIKQYEILRTRFFEDSGHPWQVIEDADKIVFEIPVINVTEPIFDSNVPEAVMKEIHLPFELESGVLFRVKLFILLDSDFILTIVFHHIIADLQSRITFSEELSHLYNYIITNSLPIPERPSNQYADFCQWQSDWLEQDEANKMIEEWEKEISKPVEPLRLPADFSPINIIEQEGRRKYFQLDRWISQKITLFAKKQGLSPFIVLLGAYSAFLNRLSDQSSIIIGVPFANRRREKFKSTFGCFTNILPIPVDFSDNPSFNILLSRVRKSMLRAHRKQEIPYLLLNSIFGGKDGLGMVQAGFTFESPIEIDLNNLEVTPVKVERDGLQLEFFLTFWEAGGCFNSFFEYPYQFYKEDTIKRFWEIFITLIKEALLMPDVCVGDMNLIPVEDIKYIWQWNNTESPFSRHLCIHKKFEQQVKQSPDAPALYFNNQSMSYSELNNHSNKLAHYLINKGIKVEDKIGICIDRSPEMMIGILGILKAGAAYLPLNHDNPAERLKVILENADPVLILSGEDTSANLPEGSKVTLIDDIIEKPFSEDASNPRVKVNSRNLAYIIYTSGSTGDPKGVMIEHYSVLNRLNWMQKAYFIDASDKLIQKTSITFDVSVWELFWWFFNGASLVLLEKDGEKDPDTIICAITRYNVTTIHFVPSMFSAFNEVLKVRNLYYKLKGLNRLFLSGEALSSQLVKEFNEKREDHILPELINLYGPTEATVDVSYFNCPESKVNKVFIGRPIDNTKLFVVSKRNKLQPVGIPGELIITGVNLARGYLNDNNLTNKKFFDLQVSSGERIRAYHSGDIVKLPPEGELEYIGRMDNQVKIRGFRVEPGEIESKILEHSSVSNCAVITRNNLETNSLIAYVCFKTNDKIGEDSLKNYLSKKLPEYMIPSRFVFLTKLPLTISGKLDRIKLPSPDQIQLKNKFEVPSSNFEKRLLSIWKFLLKREEIDVNDNFFDLGGNSLLAIIMTSKVAEEFDIVMNAMAIFEYSSIRKLGEFISSGIKESFFPENDKIFEKTRHKTNLRRKIKDD